VNGRKRHTLSKSRENGREGQEERWTHHPVDINSESIPCSAVSKEKEEMFRVASAGLGIETWSKGEAVAEEERIRPGNEGLRAKDVQRVNEVP